MLLNYKIYFYNNIVILSFFQYWDFGQGPIYFDNYTHVGMLLRIRYTIILVLVKLQDLFYIKLNHKLWVNKEGNNNLNFKFKV